MAFGSQCCTPVSDLEANLLFFYILGTSPDIVLARTMNKFSAAATKSIGVLHRPCDPQADAPDRQAGAPEELQEQVRDPESLQS